MLEVNQGACKAALNSEKEPDRTNTAFPIGMESMKASNALNKRLYSLLHYSRFQLINSPLQVDLKNKVKGPINSKFHILLPQSQKQKTELDIAKAKVKDEYKQDVANVRIPKIWICEFRVTLCGTI